MLRAAYYAQELLTTFPEDIHGVMLHPSGVNGSFVVSIDGQQVWNRKTMNGFPEAKVLKQLVRDIVNPQKQLGHSDRK